MRCCQGVYYSMCNLITWEPKKYKRNPVKEVVCGVCVCDHGSNDITMGPMTSPWVNIFNSVYSVCGMCVECAGV